MKASKRQASSLYIHGILNTENTKRNKIIFQLRQEKVELEQTLEKEQEYQVNKLMRKIEKLEADTISKQATLEQVRRIFFSRNLNRSLPPDLKYLTSGSNLNKIFKLGQTDLKLMAPFYFSSVERRLN